MILRPDGAWDVESRSRVNTFHTVVKNGDVWKCTCEAYKFNIEKDNHYICKHIIEVKMSLKRKELADKFKFN